ncbi:MAG: hypothetical protein A2X05_17875 [Bacteroidetes bacterium GWE2_41_25]|nr:MAG: hypothetical protein A2X05_17875 [Bacteroidetes bacterium GWE2_41_25]OFX99534.1 MAG: hypothetical protein A2X06_10580 [Bacteroidetes bacterium GWC2_40_22]HBH85490.1 hypothetical protein [Bacteroidales bacterium]HCU19691.1 hypothetical protein [Bacteroidales bacterium]
MIIHTNKDKMKFKTSLIITAVLLFIMSGNLLNGQNYDLRPVVTLNIGSRIGQLRAVPVKIGDKHPYAVAFLYSEEAEVDPWEGMFFFPKHTLKLAVMTTSGELLWRRDLGEGVVPGIWFSPLFAFDLDEDGVDELWIINNRDPEHPLNYHQYVLQKIDPETGKKLSEIPWPKPEVPQELSHLYRHFILGAYVNGNPLLLTAQGTYGPMRIQAWNKDMSMRREHIIPKNTPGALGSHVTPVGQPVSLGFDIYTTIPVDINGDGIHELVKGYFEGNGDLIDSKGKILGNIGGLSAMACKFTPAQGEQILSYSKDGWIKIWADVNAKDNQKALNRYANPFYKRNRIQTGNGYNLFTLGGI